MKTPKKNNKIQNNLCPVDGILLADLKMLRLLVNEKKTPDGTKVEYVFDRFDFANRLN